MSGNFTDIFTPVDGDFALISLRRVLGCTVDTIWQGTANASCGQSELIASAASFFNMAVAIVATVLVTYTVWTGIANTASEGEAMGGASTKYTIARVGLGAIMILPVSSGFNLAQILVIQLLVWGSGAADNLWTKAASSIQAGGYTASAVVGGADLDPRQRGELARALYVRTAGHLCANSLNSVQAMFDAEGTKIAPSVSQAQGWLRSGVAVSRGFGAGGFWNNADSICGSINYKLAPESLPIQDGEGIGTYESLNRLANQVAASSMSSALDTLDGQAQKLAQLIEDKHDVTALKSAFSQGLDAVAKAMAGGIEAGLKTGEASDLAQHYLTRSTEQGWVMAPSWQRAMVNVANKMETIRRSVTLQSVPPDNLSTYVPGSWDSPSWQTIAAGYVSDISFLQTIAGFVADFVNPSPGGTQGTQAFPMTDAGLVATAMRSVLSVISVEDNAGAFLDPFAALQATGAALTYAAAGSQAAGLAIDLLPQTRLVAAATGVGGWFSTLALGLAAAGFVLGAVLPLLPLAYFFAAVVGWLVQAIEAMLAVVLWILGFFTPAGEPSLFAGAREGLLMLLSVLVRPTLIITGLVASLLVASVSVQLLNLYATSILAITIPIDGGPAASGLLGLGAVGFYVMAAVLIVMHSSALITDLPDTVLRWVGVASEQHTQRFAGAAAAAVAPTAMLGRSGSRLLSAGRGAMPPRLRGGPTPTDPKS